MTDQQPQQPNSSRRRLTEVHVAEAKKLALRLFATTSTVFPAEWAERDIVEQTAIDASEFAYHARRVIDLCGFRNRQFENVDQLRFALSPGQNVVFVTNFHEALNRLHHVRDFVFHWTVREGVPTVWLASARDMIPCFLRISTDQREEANISLFGVAVCFLSSVVPAVIQEFPDYRF